MLTPVGVRRCERWDHLHLLTLSFLFLLQTGMQVLARLQVEDSDEHWANGMNLHRPAVHRAWGWDPGWATVAMVVQRLVVLIMTVMVVSND